MSASLNLRNPVVLMVIGVAATLVFTLVVVWVLLWAGDAEAVKHNAALIGALVALGGVFTAQMVGIALDDRRNREAALQNYFERVGKVLTEKSLYEERLDMHLV